MRYINGNCDLSRLKTDRQGQVKCDLSKKLVCKLNVSDCPLAIISKAQIMLSSGDFSSVLASF